MYLNDFHIRTVQHIVVLYILLVAVFHTYPSKSREATTTSADAFKTEALLYLTWWMDIKVIMYSFVLKYLVTLHGEYRLL